MTPLFLHVEDHAGVRKALGRLLEQDARLGGMDLVGVATWSEAVEWIERPALVCAVLVDHRLPRVPGGAPEPCGLDLLARVRRRSPRTACALLSGLFDEQLVADCAALDVPFVPRGVGRDLAPLGPFLDRGAALAAEVRWPDLDALAVGIRATEREREVLRLAALGRSRAQIARRLGCGVETAKTHVRNLITKAGAPSMAALIRSVLRLPSASSGSGLRASSPVSNLPAGREA